MILNKAIVFDFFGVICSEVAPMWFGEYFNEEESKKLKDFYFKSFDLGQTKEEDLMNDLASIANTTSDQVNIEFQRLIKIDPKVVKLIKKLKLTHKIALCSNGGSNFVRKIIEDNKLADLFDVIIISGEYGIIKPDIKIYEIVLEKLSLKPEDCIFIDDNNANVKIAEQIGMKGITYSSIQDILSLK